MLEGLGRETAQGQTRLGGREGGERCRKAQASGIEKPSLPPKNEINKYSTHLILALRLVLTRALMMGGRILPSVALETQRDSRACWAGGRGQSASHSRPPHPCPYTPLRA
jgi:hypothetical protein